jgi:hypothetical protein
MFVATWETEAVGRTQDGIQPPLLNGETEGRRRAACQHRTGEI